MLEKIVDVARFAKSAVAPGQDGMLEAIGAQVRGIVQIELVTGRIATESTGLNSHRPGAVRVELQLDRSRRIVGWLASLRDHAGGHDRGCAQAAP